jgi:hypothetical protein
MNTGYEKKVSSIELGLMASNQVVLAMAAYRLLESIYLSPIPISVNINYVHTKI